MKNIFKYSTLLALCSLLGLVACTEELSTDQFSDETVVFGAFAPNPVVRGAELRIMGSNLDRIAEVQIPGAEPITEIEVVSAGRVSEIRVVTPKAGAEDASVTGPVVIVDKEGNVYKSKTDISFAEGIVLDSFEPANAMPGDVVTVKGDYLYNVQQVVLGGGVHVTGEQITEKSRRELKFIVPSNAITGPVTIGDVNELDNPDGLIPNNVPSETDLTIGDPTVTASARGVIKAGTEVTVTGKYLDMIANANFAGVAAEFTVAKDGKSLKLALPETAVDGELVLISYAGKEFKAGAYTTVVPTGIAIAAESRFKAGLNAVISGKDLDLVTGAALEGTTLEFGFKDNKLTFAIPAKAVDGKVVLTLANGKTVETEAVELVKPAITEMTPLELYAGDENITVKGSDLDLVSAVTLGGREAEFELSNGEITVKTTLTSVSGKVALTLENGVVVESAEAVTVKYHSKVIVTEMPEAQHIGMQVVLKGSNFDLVENIFVGEEKVTKYSLRTAEEVNFIMPWNKVGMHSVSFHLFDGDVETLATQIEVQLELKIFVLWEGEFTIGAWNGNQDLAYGAYDWTQAKPGDVLQIIGEPVNPLADWWCLSLRVGYDWKNVVGLPGQYDNCGSIEVVLTKEIIDYLVAEGGLILTGQDYKFTKISLIREIQQEVTLWEGSFAVDWGSPFNALQTSIKEYLAPGKILRAYVTGSGQGAATTAWWNNFTTGLDGEANRGDIMISGDAVLEYTLSQSGIDKLNTEDGLLFVGSGYTITKVTIE